MRNIFIFIFSVFDRWRLAHAHGFLSWCCVHSLTLAHSSVRKHGFKASAPGFWLMVTCNLWLMVNGYGFSLVSGFSVSFHFVVRNPPFRVAWYKWLFKNSSKRSRYEYFLHSHPFLCAAPSRTLCTQEQYLLLLRCHSLPGIYVLDPS